MDLVRLSDGARIDEAAAWIAGEEAFWLKGERLVCWLALWVRVKGGVSRARAADEARVCVKNFRTRERSGIFPLWTRKQAPLMAHLVRVALAKRRSLTGVAPDPLADAAATALPVDPYTDDMPVMMHAAPDGGEGERARGAVREAEFAEGVEDARAPWREIAHEAQLAPEGPWRTWMLMGGRGAGKTRAGAEWVREQVERGAVKRVALVGPTLHDVREVMIEGESGLRAIAGAGMRPDYVASRRTLVWPPEGPCAGAVAQAFSAEDPDSLRGPQFDAAWCDEIGAWPRDVDTWKTLAFAMRLGAEPRIVATTTPRPRALVKLLVDKAERGAGGVVMTRAGTRVNAANLAPGFVAGLEDDYEGTSLARQELDGELVEDLPGAMWTRGVIEANRASLAEAVGLERVVVAVDPPGGDGATSDACGIVAAGVKDGVVYVLADATVRGLRPAEWGRRVALTAETWGAGCVVAEGNVGRALVRDVLKEACGAGVRVVMRHAGASKEDRAQPVSAMYEHGRVRHVRVLKELEDQMCAFGGEGGRGRGRGRSPDRVDALVWAVDELTRTRAKPGVMRL